jgi:tetratricopeptide (TPR) repeat protein
VLQLSAPDLLERLREILPPNYQLGPELGRGAGTLLALARDVSLKRAVVIKVLDPALTGQADSRRFIREARILASLSHPNIVAIHETGELGGLLYYVRDYLEGEPLSVRLARGPLPKAEVLNLARDLLAALGIAHRAGVIHRDLHPDHVFCLEDRAVLADFGIAQHAVDSDGDLSQGEGTTVRSEYAAPEQVAGNELSSRTDLYVAGMVLYHAFTARHWRSGAPVAEGTWSEVPRWVRPALRRALAPVPVQRWDTAAAFQQALEPVEEPSPQWPRPFLVLVAAALIWGVARGLHPAPSLPGLVPAQLAVLPLVAGDGTEGDSLGMDLAYLIHRNLDNLPGLPLTSFRQVLLWLERRGSEIIGEEKFRAARELRVHWVAHGAINRRRDSLLVDLTLYDSLGRKIAIPEVKVPRGDLGLLSDSLALLLVRTIAPHLAGSYRVVGDLGGVRLSTLREFLRGEAAFQQDAWANAESHYQAAVDLDSSFALAAWRLANLRRWRRLQSDTNLLALYDRPDARLRPLDRALIEALSEPELGVRLARLDSLIARNPEDGYARFLYGEELFHRGPLVGRGIEEGAQAMADAIARDSSLALAYDHLILTGIRLGRRDYAREMLDRRRRVSRQPSTGDPDVLALSELAYDERFVPWQAGLKRRYLAATADSAQIAGVSRLFRTGNAWFDIPATQVALGDLLLKVGRQDPASRASAHEGKGIGLLALGRTAEALAEIDTAAGLFNSDVARLEQAELRIVLPALGLPLGPETRDWRRQLGVLSADPTLAPRAFWALALGSLAAGDTAEAVSWRNQLIAGQRAPALERFLAAMLLAAAGRWQAARALSDSLSVPLNSTGPPDPFARAVFHLERGRWLRESGQPDDADREWRWYESSDVAGWPEGLMQAGEVDGMLGVYARLLRARALLRPGGSPAQRRQGCGYVKRVSELWSGADLPMRALKNEADSLARTCSP